MSSKIDRSSWSPGPWDNEPDSCEWITVAGYKAKMYRLKSGAWAASIMAPHPADTTSLLTLCHAMSDKRKNQMTHQLAMISKTDVKKIGEFCLSMEHWDSPGPVYVGRDWNRGPYKTLEEVKQIVEDVAKDIFDLNKAHE